MRLAPIAALAAAVLVLSSPASASPRDPFTSVLDEMGQPDPQKPPLQRTPLRAMKVQGVIAGTASPRALVLLPDGSAHLVRVGDAIGPALGRVKKIRRGEVVVVEAFQDAYSGRRTVTETVLTVGS